MKYDIIFVYNMSEKFQDHHLTIEVGRNWISVF